MTAAAAVIADVLFLLLCACTHALDPVQTAIHSSQTTALSHVLSGMGLPLNATHFGLPIATTCWNSPAYWDRVTYNNDIACDFPFFDADSFENEKLGAELCHGGRPGLCSSPADVCALTSQLEHRHNGLCCQADGIVRML
jgi:hypothetical protein